MYVIYNVYKIFFGRAAVIQSVKNSLFNNRLLIIIKKAKLLFQY